MEREREREREREGARERGREGGKGGEGGRREREGEASSRQLQAGCHDARTKA